MLHIMRYCYSFQQVIIYLFHIIVSFKLVSVYVYNYKQTN